MARRRRCGPGLKAGQLPEAGAQRGRLIQSKGRLGHMLTPRKCPNCRVLPKPPSPLGAYVEASQVGSLLFVSGTLPLRDGQLAISGRLGACLSVEQGREAARLAALNALAAARERLGDLDRLKKPVKLSVFLLTTEDFVEHAAVADGASNLFVQLFGAAAGHVRVVYGVPSTPVGTPVIVETVFEIEPPPLGVQRATL
jgi:enamine deaminase RidA (YjgF/YER057c/UK114 family)